MMGKKKKKSLNTMGTAANPFKCGAGSGCPDKGEECRLWHPTDDQQHLPQSKDMSSVDIAQEEVRTNETFVSSVLKGGKEGGGQQIPCILVSLGNADLPIAGMPF